MIWLLCLVDVIVCCLGYLSGLTIDCCFLLGFVLYLFCLEWFCLGWFGLICCFGALIILDCLRAVYVCWFTLMFVYIMVVVCCGLVDLWGALLMIGDCLDNYFLLFDLKWFWVGYVICYFIMFVFCKLRGWFAGNAGLRLLVYFDVCIYIYFTYLLVMVFVFSLG